MPGNDVKKIAKVAALNVDCVVLDCEDGVAANKKEEARWTIARMLGEGVDLGRAECSVRINSIDSGLAEQDLQCVMSSSRKPSTVMVPKVESVGHIDWIADRLRRYNASSASSPVKLAIFAESARALLDLDGICRHAASCHRGGPFVLDAIVFGSDDFCADIGATRTASATEVLYARQRLVTVAKAHRLQAIDMVYIDYKDPIGLKDQSLEGARMGFTGKQVIHPGQIATVQDAFAPSDAAVEWATELTKAFREHQSSGKASSPPSKLPDRPDR